MKQPVKSSNGVVRAYEYTVGQYTTGIQQALPPTIISGLRAAGFHELAKMCEKGAPRAVMQAKLDGHDTNFAGAKIWTFSG